MPVDNRLYDRLATTWWEEDENMALLRTGINPARFGYMHRVLTKELAVDLRGKCCLDVGCGGGLLAEEFAKRGCRVTGVDPSGPSLETARAHAAKEGLEIEYVASAGEDIPFEDASFASSTAAMSSSTWIPSTARSPSRRACSGPAARIYTTRSIEPAAAGS